MSQHRILIVDDEDDIRAVVRQVLSRNYEVVEAVDGLDALQKLPHAEPDLVVMDVMMPLMDGFRACEAIRRDPKFADLPVLFLSALNTREDMVRGYAAGANLYLPKPFDPLRLLRNVELHFQTSAIPPRPKRYTLSRLLDVLQNGPVRPAPEPRKRGGEFATPVPSDYPEGSPATPPMFASRNPHETQSDSTPVYPRGAARPRVMVVDDEEDVRQMLMHCLSDLFEVVVARDGLVAVERIVRWEPDIMMLDALMPRMSGYQLCQSIRRNRRFAALPVMFISAKATPKDIAYAKRLGADDYVAKPFEMEELRAKLLHLTRRPGFEVAPKTLPYQVVEAEMAAAESEESEREKLRAESMARAPRPGSPRASRSQELEQFLREEGE